MTVLRVVLTVAPSPARDDPWALFELWFLVPLPKGPIEHLLGF